MPEFTTTYNDALISLRKQLHKNPEVAHQEKDTAAKITEFLQHFSPDTLITNIGGHGVAAVYRGKANGARVMIRCELDALPILEKGNHDYLSENEGVAHLCGHDGHMVMVAGLAPLLSSERPESGEVVLLFQPAEETGEGASLVLKDPKFKQITPDYIFALHNLPGYPYASVILKKNIFASASRGLILTLTGKSSHAGIPEDGANPTLAATQIIQSILSIPSMHLPLESNAKITPIHTRIGGPAFGTSPGEGQVMFTLRAHSNETMDLMAKKAIALANKIAEAHGIKTEIEWTEPFEAVENDSECVDIISKCANLLRLKIIQKELPFPWSEDFGVFSGAFKGALFGLGSGADQPQLHNEIYDFPDQIIESGTMVFYQIIGEILSKSE